MSGLTAAIVCDAYFKSYCPAPLRPCWMLNVMTRNSTLAAGAVGDEPAAPDEPDEPHATKSPAAASMFRMDGVGRMPHGVRDQCQRSFSVQASAVPPKRREPRRRPPLSTGNRRLETGHC